MAPIVSLSPPAQLPEDCCRVLNFFLKPEEVLGLARVSRTFRAESKDHEYWVEWAKEVRLIEGNEFIGREGVAYRECMDKVKRLYALFRRLGKSLKKTHFPMPTRQRFSAIHAHTRGFFQAFFKDKLMLDQNRPARHQRVPLVQVLRGFGDEYYRLFLRSISSQHLVLHTAIREDSRQLVQDLLEEGAKVTDFTLKEAIISGFHSVRPSTQCLEILLGHRTPGEEFLSSLRAFLIATRRRIEAPLPPPIRESFQLACGAAGFNPEEIQPSRVTDQSELVDTRCERLLVNKRPEDEGRHREVLRSMLLSSNFHTPVYLMDNLFVRTVSDRTVELLVQGSSDQDYPHGRIPRHGYPSCYSVPPGPPPVNFPTILQIAEINSLLDSDSKEDNRMGLAISTRDIRVVQLGLDLGARLTLDHLGQSIYTGDLNIIRCVFQEYLRLHPEAVSRRHPNESPNWLSAGVNTGEIDIVRYLLDLGCKPYNSGRLVRFRSIFEAVRRQTLNCLLRSRNKEMVRLVSERVVLEPINDSPVPYVGKKDWSGILVVSSYNEAVLWGDPEVIEIVGRLGGRPDGNTPRVLREAPRPIEIPED